MTPPAIFILGRTPELAAAELAAVLPQAKFRAFAPRVLRVDDGVREPAALLARLGGTVKIGAVVAPTFTVEAVADDLAIARAGGKVLFGISWITPSRNAVRLAAGLAVKTRLIHRGCNARLVTSRAAQLPAAAINRHGATEYVVLPDGSLARITAAQDVDDFTRRDVGRPHRDLKSGTLPPKLARILVNLARLPAVGSLLDPFCGSGTILTEAALLGVPRVVGVDVAARAVAQTQANLAWLACHYPQARVGRWSVRQGDARELWRVVGSERFNAVVTEPYLGPPRRGRETRRELERVMAALADLYGAAFQQFRHVLTSAGRVVIVLPVFRLGRERLTVPVAAAVARAGFRLEVGPLPYARPGQWVERQIMVWVRVAARFRQRRSLVVESEPRREVLRR